MGDIYGVNIDHLVQPWHSGYHIQQMARQECFKVIFDDLSHIKKLKTKKAVESMIRHTRTAIMEDLDNPRYDEMLALLLKTLQAYKPQPMVGPYSGLTKNELARTGLCEPDFY